MDECNLREWFCNNIQEMHDSIYRVAYTILHNNTDCEDAAGNAILLAYQNIYQLRNRNKFKAWLMRILKNECYAILRSREQTLPGFHEIIIESDNRPDIDLHDAIKRLRVEYRVSIVLYYLEGYRVNEIAQILEVPDGTIKSNLSRARSELRLILKDWEETKYETK